MKAIDSNPNVQATRDRIAKCQSVLDKCQRETLAAARALDRRTAEIQIAMQDGISPRNPKNKRRKPPLLATLETQLRTKQMEEIVASENLDLANEAYRSALETAYQEYAQTLKEQYHNKALALDDALERASRANSELLNTYQTASESGIKLDCLVWQELLPEQPQYASKLDNWRRTVNGLTNGCSKS